MHILFLSDNFPPETNAPASRTFEHSRVWVNAGHQVTVITCAPNFPKGEVYPGYKNKLWQTENIEGIRVIRVWTYIAANEGFKKRVLDYTSFLVSASIGSFFVRKIDLVVGTSPQFFTTVAAYFVGLVRRRPFVFELRDLWPESIKAVGAMKDSKIIRWFESLELFLYRKAARIVCVTHSFKKILIERGVDAGKIDVVTNGVERSRFVPQPKDAALLEKYSLQSSYVVGYIGTLGMAHALHTLLEAASLLKEQEEYTDISFILLGHGARKKSLIEQAENLQLDNVRFIDSVPKEEVARFWSILDVSIIHLKRIDLFHSVIPSKLFECISMGIPVLHGVEGESADIVSKENVGLCFIPEDKHDLVQKIIQLRNDPDLSEELKKNCLVAARHYDRSILADKMLESFDAALDAR